MEVINNIELVYELDYPIGRCIEANLARIKEMGKAIRKSYRDTKTPINLVCRGSSGAIISALVSKYLSKKGYTVRIVHIKKEGEVSHTCGIYLDKSGLVIIIDDFVSSGETIRQIYKALHDEWSDVEVDALVLTGHIPCQMEINFMPSKIICGTGGHQLNYKPINTK